MAQTPKHDVKPDEEDAYWREAHARQPYFKQGTDFEPYANAYRVGYLGRVKYDGRRYEEIEDELAADYARFQGNDINFDDVRPATRAAWDRIDERVRQATRN